MYEISNNELKKDEEREKSEEKEDYIERMYKLLENKKITSEFVKDLVDDFSLFLTAGTDTTSISIMMLLFYCARND